jgi:(2Fe-2S) ferredoxin
MASVEASGDCNTCVLSNTVQPYQLHVVLCDSKSPTEWEDRVENGPVVGRLRDAVRSYTSSSLTPKEIKLTCCSYTPEFGPDSNHDSSSLVSIIVYPSGSILSFPHTEERMTQVISGVYDIVNSNRGDAATQRTVIAELAHSLSDVLYMPAPWEILLLVCCHAARDKRCGRAGPQIIETIEAAKAELGADHVKVLPSSHIGGHKFAGTLVVYPSGHWFGHISKSNTKELLTSILNNDKPNWKCFRGNGFANLDF